MPGRTVTPTAADLSDKPRIERHRIRGVVYTFRELPISEYDKLVSQAKTSKEGPLGGIVEETDDVVLMKLLVLACVDIAPTRYQQLGTRVILALNKIVRAMHFAEEPEELVADGEESSDDTEGNG